LKTFLNRFIKYLFIKFYKNHYNTIEKESFKTGWLIGRFLENFDSLSGDKKIVLEQMEKDWKKYKNSKK